MTGVEATHALPVLLIGGVIVSAVLVRNACARVGVPSVVGFIVLGVLLGWGTRRIGLLPEPVRYALELFADLGIIALLFRVGLDSKLKALLAKLPRASIIWLSNVAVAGATGFIVAYYIGEFGVVPSLVVATALTATSAGVSTGIWQEAGALQSSTGRLLVDVAELDDVSAVILMALLLALVPVLLAGDVFPWSQIMAIGGTLLLKLLTFLGLCLVFAAYIERYVTRVASKSDEASQRMLIVAGFGFMIAASADSLGFSLAIGALGAGLVFSRDPQAVKTEARFEDLYALFVPFFFVRIGMQAELTELTDAGGLAIALLSVAIVGKLVGAGLPTWFIAGPSAAVVIGLSMVPRAEIAMVIVDAARRLGPDVMPRDAYAAMVLVVLGTCLVTPWLLAPRLHGQELARVATL